MMRRNDLLLLLGVWTALFTIVSQPLGRALAYAYEVDQARGLQLLPALVILAVVFTVHQVRRRHEARADVLISAAAAREATARVAEMKELVGLGQALGESLTVDSIGDVAARYFPMLADGRPAWVMIRSGSSWRRLAVTGDRPLHECEAAARRALGDTSMGAESGVRADICFPMLVGGESLGVLGVSSEPPLTEPRRIILAATAELLAVSLKNAELFHKLHETSVRDGLTGCATRAHAMAVIETELTRSLRSKLAPSLIMFDLDHFKQINDQFGHLCGDAVLAAVGQRMNTVLRRSDLKCRYGGEEFLVLLPDTTLTGARHVAESLRGKLEASPVPWNEGVVPFTASFGLTAVKPGELDITAIIGRADAALYRAKESGRNCINSD